MANPNQMAFEALQRMALQWKDIIAVAPHLAKIASLENATAEAQAALDAVRAQILNERPQHEAALAAERMKVLDGAHAEAADIKSEARAVAARIRSDVGVDKARAELAQAKREAEETRAEAARIRSEAEAEASAVRESVAAAQAQLVEINSRIAGLKTIEADWGAKAVAAKAEHDRVVSIHREFVAKVGLR